MRKILTLLTVLMLGILTAYAQERSISGKVTDSSGSPVPYATIKVVGGRSGQVADNAGNLVLNLKQAKFSKFQAVVMQHKLLLLIIIVM